MSEPLIEPASTSRDDSPVTEEPITVDLEPAETASDEQRLSVARLPGQAARGIKAGRSLGERLSASILIAGLGNMFLGDDAFGIEVIRRLRTGGVPRNVNLKTFGIRSDDLPDVIAKGYGLVIIVNTARRGTAPGTIYVSQLRWDEAVTSDTGVSRDPSNDLLPVVSPPLSSGAIPGKIYMVECEPDRVENVEGMFRMTRPVSEAILRAVHEIETLIQEFLSPAPQART